MKIFSLITTKYMSNRPVTWHRTIDNSKVKGIWAINRENLHLTSKTEKVANQEENSTHNKEDGVSLNQERKHK